VEKKFAGRDVIQNAGEWLKNRLIMAYRDQLAKILADPDVRKALEN
jgi:hypothetical protein